MSGSRFVRGIHVGLWLSVLLISAPESARAQSAGGIAGVELVAAVAGDHVELHAAHAGSS